MARWGEAGCGRETGRGIEAGRWHMALPVRVLADCKEARHAPHRRRVEDLALGVDAPLDVVLLHSILVDLRVGVNVPADVVHDLRPVEELRGGLRAEPSLSLGHQRVT